MGNSMLVRVQAYHGLDVWYHMFPKHHWVQFWKLLHLWDGPYFPDSAGLSSITYSGLCGNSVFHIFKLALGSISLAVHENLRLRWVTQGFQLPVLPPWTNSSIHSHPCSCYPSIDVARHLCYLPCCVSASSSSRGSCSCPSSAGLSTDWSKEAELEKSLGHGMRLQRKPTSHQPAKGLLPCSK